MNNLDLCLEVF